MQKPSVGRVVHYVSYGTPGGEYQSECRAAVVTELTDAAVHEETGVPQPLGLIRPGCSSTATSSKTRTARPAAPGTGPSALTDRVVSRITIERFITDAGEDLVHVDSDDLNGGRLAVVEALGLLQLAIYDVSNAPDADDADSPD